MLTEIRICQLGVIEDTTVDLAPGLTVVSGETGAGKTMVVSSLSLLSGQRAESQMVRSTAEKAIIEARFSQISPELSSQIADLGAELDGEELLVARQITTNGRSRAFIGGVQTPVTKLAEITTQLVAIHGQNEQVKLASATRQKEIVDRYCDLEHSELLQRYRQQYRRWREAVKTKQELIESSAERARQLDLLKFGLGEIEKISPKPGEDAQLLAEVNRLQAVDDLKMLAAKASAMISGSDYDESIGAAGLISQARKTLEQICQLDPAMESSLDLVLQAEIQISETGSAIASYVDGLEPDPLRLEQANERLAAIQSLQKKYGKTIEEVLDWATRAAQEAQTITNSDEQLVNLDAEIANLNDECQKMADQLTQNRQQAANQLAAQLQKELSALAMPKARIEFRLDRLTSLSPDGQDSIQLLFSANPGMELGPLSKIASGGELSRIRLAIEVTIGEKDPGHIFVFDEVDAGIGGAVAIEVGKRLARLARHSQVLVVTHLAQVAAFADQHYLVKKSSTAAVTASELVNLTMSERASELARMMGGTVTDSGLEHANELLELASKTVN